MLGQFPIGNEPRDAIHIAIIPIQAGEALHPGDKVELTGGKAFKHVGYKPIGVVDPFITGQVYPNQWFWLCLYPKTVINLRHEWEHPAFPPSKEASEKWLRDFVSKADCPSYEILLAAALGEPLKVEYYGEAYTIDSEYLVFYGSDAHGDIPPELWMHIENVTGKKCKYKPTMFSCSC